MSLFPTATPTVQTKEQIVTKQIDLQLKTAAASLLSAYKNILALVNANANFKNQDGSYNPAAVYAAFAANTTTGLNPQQLQQAAMTVKAVINLFGPGTVTDAVPNATISFPSN